MGEAELGPWLEGHARRARIRTGAGGVIAVAALAVRLIAHLSPLMNFATVGLTVAGVLVTLNGLKARRLALAARTALASPPRTMSFRGATVVRTGMRRLDWTTADEWPGMPSLFFKRQTYYYRATLSFGPVDGTDWHPDDVVFQGGVAVWWPPWIFCAGLVRTVLAAPPHPRTPNTRVTVWGALEPGGVLVCTGSYLGSPFTLAGYARRVSDRCRTPVAVAA